MEKHHEFCPSDRYKYDSGLCSGKNGFSQLDTKQDASYFGTWANPTKFIIFCYCEGDTTTTICDNPDEFAVEINSIAEWNIKQGWGFAIDPGWKESDCDPWYSLGLGHFCH